MQLEKEIEELQLRLNSSKLVKGTMFRRNETIYPLICYINNITGCYISQNYEVASLFIKRARKHMKDTKEKESYKDYYPIASEYLNTVELFIQKTEINTSKET